MKAKKAGRILAVLLLVLLAAGIAGYAVFSHYFSFLQRASEPKTPPPDSAAAGALSTPEPLPLDDRPTPEPAATPDPNNPLARTGVYNLLLLGNDSLADSYDTRTDTMMMVTIQKEKKKIILTSFLRDTYIYIPDWGYQRLNVANIVGGPEKTEETILYHYGVETDNYAFVNFLSFVDAIDAMGGVDIALDELEVYYINQWTEGPDLPYQDTGDYHLNGEQVLAFCRVRSIGGDTRRTEQQRRVITALWETVKGLSFRQMSDTAETVFSQTMTDIDKMTLLSLLASVPALKDYEIVQQQIPADGTFTFATIDGASVLDVDFAANRAILQELIYAAE